MSAGIPPKDNRNPYGKRDPDSKLVNRNPEVLIKKYFQQLTSGCGSSSCHNIHCVSGGRTALSCDEAAAMALRLLLEKAQICPDETDSQPVPEETVKNPVLNPEPFLSVTYLQNIINSCQNEFHDFKPLVHILGKVFSSPELLNKSFLIKDTTPPVDSPESIIPVNHVEVVECYNLLFNLQNDSVENSIINGINALGNSIEIQLKSTKATLKKEDLNQFIIVFLNPNLHSPEYLESALPNILRALSVLPLELQCILVQCWAKYPARDLQKLLDIFQQMITVRILTGPHATTSLPVNDDHPITNSVKCMKLIYYASLMSGESAVDIPLTYENITDDEKKDEEPMSVDLLVNALPPSTDNTVANRDELLKKLNLYPSKCRKPLMPYEDFVNECLNEAIEKDRDFAYYKDSGIRFSFLNYPFILSTASKSQALFFDNRIRMYTERQLSILGFMSGQIPSPYLKLRVRRDHLVQDALIRLEMVAQDAPEDFRKQFVVEFEGEQGIDEGGISKEFFQLVIEELFNRDFGMFVFDDDTRTCWFNQSSFENENQFTLIGLLFGIAIYNSVILDVHFPPVLYRKLLNLHGRFDDLEFSHPTIYRSLKELLEYDGDIEADIMTTFEISYDSFGSTVTHELVKDGKNINVTKNNRQEYVWRYSDFLLNSSIKKQFEAFKRGFDIVTRDSMLSTLCRPEDLEFLVCGSKVFDIGELEEATEYDGGYDKNTPVIRYFWDIVHKLDEEQVKQLLNFTTGSDRIPVGGLAKLKLIIAKNGEDSERLPTAHTCYNVLLLPEYSTAEKTENRLLKAISNAKGFGLM